MVDDQSSEEWLDRQKQKLNAMKEGRYSEEWKERQNRQLVEELKSRQHSWKQEKTEKTTETIEGGGSPIHQSVEVPAGNVALHPIQIGTIGDDHGSAPRSLSAKYYYETKHRETDDRRSATPPVPAHNGHVAYRHGPEQGGNYSRKESFYNERNTTTDGRRQQGERYEALNSLPVRSSHMTARHGGNERPVPVYTEHGGGSGRSFGREKGYHEDTRSNYSHSQGYNTLTSEDEFYEDRARAGTLKSTGTLGGRTEVAQYHGANADNTLRVRSQSFGTAGPAAEIFREAARHVGPDGELIYTSRRYDTKKTTTDPPRPAPVAIRQPCPVEYYVDDDGAVVVTETYKRVREVKTDGGSCTEQYRAPAPALASPIRDRMILDRGPAPGGDEEYTYRRKLYESQTVPAPSFTRSRSAHDFQQDGNYYRSQCRDSDARGDGGGGRTYYYHKTSSYDDVDPVPPARTNGYCKDRYYDQRETERGSHGYARQQPLQSSRYDESHRYGGSNARREEGRQAYQARYNEQSRTDNRCSRTAYDRYNTGGSTSSSYYDHNESYPPYKSHPPSRREMEELNIFLKDFGDIK